MLPSAARQPPLKMGVWPGRGASDMFLRPWAKLARPHIYLFFNDNSKVRSTQSVLDGKLPPMNMAWSERLPSTRFWSLSTPTPQPKGNVMTKSINRSSTIAGRTYEPGLAASPVFAQVTRMSTGEERAINILRELHAAEEELVGRDVVVTDGKAGTIEHVYL